MSIMLLACLLLPTYLLASPNKLTTFQLAAFDDFRTNNNNCLAPVCSLISKYEHNVAIDTFCLKLFINVDKGLVEKAL